MTDADNAPTTYPVGLRLEGRRVVVVGGGGVAQRRVPTLIAAGARVTVVSPELTPALEGMSGEFAWEARGYRPGDLTEAWYVVAATDDHQVNQAVSAEAEERRIFCVRSDDAAAASAWTPAVGRHDTLTVAVLGNREPRKSAAVRDGILAALADGRIATDGVHHKTPGVVLVGGGPGDPELLTVAAVHALRSADVVVADRLAPREALAELAPHVELIDVSKLPRGRSASQDAINEVIVSRALAGKRVVRFKGGDNFVFGRGFEEILACREAGVPVTVVPGITSPIAVPGLAGIPVTHRGVAHEFTVVSGHVAPGDPASLVDWPSIGRLKGTLVLMMAVQNAPVIARELMSHGRDPRCPVAIVCDGTMPTQRTYWSRLGELEADLGSLEVKPPAIIVIGKVVAVANPERYAVDG